MQGQKSPAAVPVKSSSVPVKSPAAVPVKSSSVPSDASAARPASVATVAVGVLVAVVVVSVGELPVGGVAVGVPVGEAVALVGDAGDAQPSELVCGEGFRGQTDRNMKEEKKEPQIRPRGNVTL